HNLPSDIMGCMATLFIKDSITNAVTTSVWRGIFRPTDNNLPDHIDATDGQLVVYHGDQSEYQLILVSLENRLDVLIPQFGCPAGNGMYPNDYLREIYKFAGLETDAYAHVPSGPLPGLKKIKLGDPGATPSVTPQPGITFLEWTNTIVADHCLG